MMFSGTTELHLLRLCCLAGLVVKPLLPLPLQCRYAMLESRVPAEGQVLWVLLLVLMFLQVLP